MPLLDVHTTIVAYKADAPTKSPQRRYVDWARNYSGLTVERPESKEIVLEPGSTQTIFSGVRATSTDGTSAFSLALNSAKSGVYRLTWTGGTNPVFRTNRNLNFSTYTVTVAINNNATVTFTLQPGDPITFTGVQVGDEVFIPHTTTGDSASPFNVLNVGFWKVLGVSTKVLTCKRPVGDDFEGTAQVATIASAGQFQAFSSAGVQPEDSVEISAGFSSVTWATYPVQTVTASFIEFTSAQSLPLETGILPGDAGLVFYDSAKRFLHVEADQECAVRLNSDAGNTNKLSPLKAGDADLTAFLTKVGPVYSLVVVNLSQETLTLNVITAE